MIKFHDIFKTAIKSGIFLSVTMRVTKPTLREYILLTVLDSDHHKHELYYESEAVAQKDYDTIVSDVEPTKVLGYRGIL